MLQNAGVCVEPEVFDKHETGILRALSISSGQDFRIDIHVPLHQVMNRFEAQPTLCGVMVYDGENFVTVLSRTMVTHRLSHNFNRELFLNKPVTRMVETWTFVPLQIPIDTSIEKSIGMAMSRSAEERYEPIVVIDEHQHRLLLDLFTLLDAQCQVLSDTLTDLELQRRETEEAHREQDRLNQRLIESSRQAGMAEVATSVLHNVGNVLNSVNVSASVVTDRLRASRVSNLAKAVAMIQEHENDLGEFLTTDQRGKQLPGYLRKLTDFLGSEQSSLLEEMDAMGRSLEHIKNIVNSQQTYAKGAVAVQAFDMRDLVEDALRINMLSLEKHMIQLQRQFQQLPTIKSDKHLVMQIIVNLISNAKKAVRDSGKSEKKITLALTSSTHDDQQWIQISVTDNGVGIPPENLTRIFTHGFTTRTDGHGFGLHNSANAAKQLGGCLITTSAGPNLGATFTLELPLNINRGETQP